MCECTNRDRGRCPLYRVAAGNWAAIFRESPACHEMFFFSEHVRAERWRCVSCDSEVVTSQFRFRSKWKNETTYSFTFTYDPTLSTHEIFKRPETSRGPSATADSPLFWFCAQPCIHRRRSSSHKTHSIIDSLCRFFPACTLFILFEVFPL